MPLTAESQAVLQVLADNGVPPLDSLPATEGRALFNEIFKAKPEDQEPVDRVEELTINANGVEIPGRLYAPKSDTPLPVLVHFHGGGWVLMNLESHDVYCRQLSNRTGCAVVAVEYRKAPEHPAPAAVDDCYGALLWVVDNADQLGIDSSRIGVVGDSAGGNLAAIVAIMARDGNGPKISCQVLTYPAVDATMANPTIKENAEAPILGESTMTWFWNHYLDGQDRTDPMISPLYAQSHAGLPPAIVSTAEFDPLRGEGDAYAQKLKSAGCDVDHVSYEGVFHGFMLMGNIIPEAVDLIDKQAAFIKQHLV